LESAERKLLQERLDRQLRYGSDAADEIEAEAAKAPQQVPIEQAPPVAPAAAPDVRSGPAPVRERDLYGMDPAAVIKAHDDAVNFEKNIEKEIFGEADAKRYQSAQRTVNSSMADPNSDRYKAALATIDELEGRLSETQQKQLFGVNDGTGVLNAEQLKDARLAVEQHGPDALVDVADEELQAMMGRLLGGQNPDGIYVRLSVAGVGREMVRRGASQEEVLRQMGEALIKRGVLPEDAALIAKQRLEGFPKAEAAPAHANGAAPASQAQRELRSAPEAPKGRPNTAAQTFNNELDAKLGIGPDADGNFNDVAFRNPDGSGGVRVAYSLDGDNQVTIKTIESLESTARAGKATMAMRAIIEAADKQGIILKLNASPFGEKALKREELRDFYRKFGFEEVQEGSGRMVRNPGDENPFFREVQKTPTERDFDIQRVDGGFKIIQGGQPLQGDLVFKTAGEANRAAASLRDAVRVPTEYLTNLTKSIHNRIMSGQSMDDIMGVLDGIEFNFHWVQSPENARAWINAVAEAQGLTTSRKSMEETAKSAQELFGGSSPAEALSIAQEFLGKTENLDGYVAGLRAYQHAVAGYVAHLSSVIDLAGPKADALDMEKLRTALGTLFDVNPSLKKGLSNVARGLNAAKSDAPMAGIQYLPTNEGMAQIPLTETIAKKAAAAPRAPASGGVFAGMTKKEMLAVARHLRLTGGDPKVIEHYLKEVLAVTPPARGTPAWELFQSIRYNSMLSGTLTHTKNIVSNFGMFLLKNSELMGHGLSTGDKKMFDQGLVQMSSLFHDSLESLRVAMQSAREGTALLDPESGKEGLKELLDSMTRATETSGPKAWLRRIWNAPGTFLMAEDEFFKQLNYRASVRAQAYAAAKEMFPADPKRWGSYVENAINSAFTSKGAAINTTALHMARENTFTTELRGFAQGFSQLRERSKIAQFFFPFVRTPINIFLSAAERTPGLWRASTLMREELAGKYGADRAAQALAKIEMGQNLWLVATGLAASGFLTGGGPRDPKLRNQKSSTGWIPYAFVHPETGKQVSFRAVEPFATIFGIAADATESWDDLSREARRSEQEEMLGAFLAATAANVSNKTFLKGLSDMTDLFSGSEGAWEKLGASLGQQAIPFGGLLSQTVNQDDLMRDVQSIGDRVLSRVPYFSEGLEPVRNVLGKPLPKQSWVERAFWPFTMDEQAGTREQQVIKALSEGIGEGQQLPYPDATRYDGLIDLRDREAFARAGKEPGKDQSPYDRLLELYGTGMTVSEYGMKQTLPPIEDAFAALISEDTDKLIEYFGPTGALMGYWKTALPKDGIDVTESNTRLGLVRAVMSKYQEAAMKVVRKEYPKLEAEFQKHEGQKRSQKFDQTMNQIESLREAYVP
jgi:hypothetical protein